MKRLLVRLTFLFMTTTILSGCVWPWGEDYEGRHHEGGYHEGHHHEHHDERGYDEHY